MAAHDDRIRHRLRFSSALLLLCASCSPSGDSPASTQLGRVAGADVVFLVQPVAASEAMAALFEGRVVKDAAGCLRLDSPDPATVVWPFGFTVAHVDGELTVLDADTRVVGTIPGSFRISGGEVPVLQGQLTAEDRAYAVQRCPGRFWIAGEVSRL